MMARYRHSGLMFSVGLLVLGAAIAQACKKKEQPIEYPSAQPTPTPTPTPTPAPTPTSTATAQLPGDGGPVALDATTTAILDEVIKRKAKTDAPYMKRVGTIFGATVAEGGRFEQTIMIDPGKCYSVIAVGGAGIEEVDLEIQARAPIPGLPGATIAVDNSMGREASIKPCWKNALPAGFPATVVMKATRGTGALGGQVFVK
ncbi:MAG: hypothetical protein R3B13_37245 [Polyangiaceae bacterium]